MVINAGLPFLGCVRRYGLKGDKPSLFLCPSHVLFGPSPSSSPKKPPTGLPGDQCDNTSGDTSG